MSILTKVPQRISSLVTGCKAQFAINRPASTLFKLHDEQRVVQKMCRSFAEIELEPVAEEHDRNSAFPYDQIYKLGKLGLMGMCAKREHGGTERDTLSASLAIEELSKACASTGLIVSIHNCLYCDLIQSRGTPEQIEQYLKPFVSGQIGAFALSERDAGSDAANVSTTARRDDDHYILNGKKTWVSSGYEAKAGIFFATVDKALSHKGIAAFLISFDTPGLMLGRKEDKLGVRASSTCDIILQDVRVPKSNVIGEIGEGFAIAMKQLQVGRIGIASQAIGIAQASLDLAVKYACERRIFGEHLIDVQLIKAKIAKMATDLESARLLTWKAATQRDNNEDYRKLSSMAKYAASQCATNNAHECIQILGGRGFVSGKSERLYRDARITQIYGGATDIQKLIIADQVVNEQISNNS